VSRRVPSPLQLLGGEERFKDVRFYSAENSGAVVANLPLPRKHPRDKFALELALSAHCVDGIVDDVGPDLIELAAKRIDEEGNRAGNRACTTTPCFSL